ncbi:UNVERIFIED_CONTAM: hypothetical protein Sangu_1162500 [Sesamum angustifolium]|uniref:Uncharacterized protein n=1 Tax=Sesamum angustifolium TaxID=2727405 RepID=A0AAW2P2J7_9LAMI
MCFGSYSKSDNASLMKFVRAFPTMESKRNFLKSLDCLEELLILEEELLNFNEAADIAKRLGDILREVDLLEKAEEFASASLLLLSHVLSSSLWASGSQEGFWNISCITLCEAKILSNEQKSLSELMQCHISSKQYESHVGEVLSIRKLLDAHFRIKSAKYELEPELHIDPTLCIDRISKNQVSGGTLVYVWYLWKLHSLEIFECLDTLERLDFIRCEGTVKLCFSYFGVRLRHDLSVTCLLLNPDAAWPLENTGIKNYFLSGLELEALHALYKCSLVNPLSKYYQKDIISLRESEPSKNLLEEIISRNLSTRLTYGQIGRVVMIMLGSGKPKPELYDKITKRIGMCLQPSDYSRMDKTSIFNFTYYFPVLLLRLFVILSLLCLNSEVPFNVLFELLGVPAIRSQLPTEFCQAFLRRKNDLYLAAVVEAFKVIGDPLVIVATTDNGLEFAHPDAVFLDLRAFSCRTDIMKTLFPRSGNASYSQLATAEGNVTESSSVEFPPVVMDQGKSTYMESSILISKTDSNLSSEKGKCNVLINWGLIRELFDAIDDRNHENLKSFFLRKKRSNSGEDKTTLCEATSIINELNRLSSLLVTSEFDDKALSEIGELLNSLEARRPQLDTLLIPSPTQNDPNRCLVSGTMDENTISHSNDSTEVREREDVNVAVNNPKNQASESRQGKGKSKKKNKKSNKGRGGRGK